MKLMLTKSGMRLIYLSLSLASVLPAATKSHSTEMTFISKIAKETTKRSGESFFHVFNFHRNFSMTPLIRDLHRNLIPTVLIEHSTDVREFATHRRVKNILFLLNDCHDIINVVLDSLAQERAKRAPLQLIAGDVEGEGSTDHGGPAEPGRPMEPNGNGRTQRPKFPKLPNYCIRYGRNSVDPFGRAFGGPAREEADCEAEMYIDAMDLEPDSMLPDEVFNLTRGLYAHNIWNGENYLVFAFFPNEDRDRTEVRDLEDAVVTDQEEEDAEICETPGCDLLFAFKFIWRFFHGYRTVICFKQQCYRYDPFYERIWEYVDAKAEYFDFSWSLMNKKPLSFLYLENETKEPGFARKFWNDIMLQAVFIMTKKLDFSLAYYGPPLEDSENETRAPRDLQSALQAGIDFHVLQGVLHDTDLATLDFSHPVDTGMLCFITPRPGAVPDSLVAFKSFTLCVWLLVLTIYLSFLLLRYGYHRLFNDPMANTPDNRFISWKLLFLTFAFSTFILITAFQTEMATLFTRRVRYADPEKIADLQHSKHLIHAANVNLHLDSEDFGYSWIRDWLTDFFSFSPDGVSHVIEHLYHLSNPIVWRNVTRGKSSLPASEPEALVFHVPYHFQRYKNFILFEKESGSDSHLVQECVVTNPYSYPVVKYSFFTDKVNELLVRLNEAGIMQHMIRQKFVPERRALTSAAKDNPDEILKVFSAADLRIAFICLLVGLVFSAGALMFETVRRFR